MSSYVPVNFVDGVTELNAVTFNRLEDRVELLDTLKVPDPAGLDEKWLKAESGAMVWTDIPAGAGIEYENDWAAATPYVAGDVVRYNGVEYLAVNPSTGVTPPGAAPGGIGYGTSLPASPVNGQEHVLVDSLTNPSYQWRFRYNAGSTSPYKWEYVGGSPATHAVGASEATAGGATWVNLATQGPLFTLPRAGDYWVEALCGLQAGATIPDSPGMGVSDNGDQAPPESFVGELNRSGSYSEITYFWLKTGRAAGDVLKMRYLAYTATTSFHTRRLRVTPVRVS